MSFFVLDVQKMTRLIKGVSFFLFRVITYDLLPTSPESNFSVFSFPSGVKKKTENNFVLQQFSVTNFTDNKSQFNAALDLILFG